MEYNIKDWKYIKGMVFKVFCGFSIPRNTRQVAIDFLGRSTQSVNDIIEIREELLKKGYIKEVLPPKEKKKKGNRGNYYEITDKAFMEILNEYSDYGEIIFTKEEFEELMGKIKKSFGELIKVMVQCFFETGKEIFKDVILTMDKDQNGHALEMFMVKTLDSYKRDYLRLIVGKEINETKNKALVKKMEKIYFALDPQFKIYIDIIKRAK